MMTTKQRESDIGFETLRGGSVVSKLMTITSDDHKRGETVRIGIYFKYDLKLEWCEYN